MASNGRTRGLQRANTRVRPYTGRKGTLLRVKGCQTVGFNLCRESFPKQILHPETSRFPHQKLSRCNRAKGETLSVESLVGEGDFVGGGGGHHAVDAVYLAFAGHINIT